MWAVVKENFEGAPVLRDITVALADVPQLFAPTAHSFGKVAVAVIGA